jgi:hypothetical protein
MISQYFTRARKKRPKFSSHKSFSSSRNGSRAAPESGIGTATNGRSFTKYAQRALPRTLTIADLTTTPQLRFSDFRKIFENFGSQIAENISEPQNQPPKL